MRSTFTFASVGFLLLFTTNTFAARPPLPAVPQVPENIKEVERIMGQTIPGYLENAQCGGWNMNVHVGPQGGNEIGKIAKVTGLPGREGVWDGAVLSGMATRKDGDGNGNSDDDFIFPDSAQGLVTACWGDTKFEKRNVWRPINPFSMLIPFEVERIDQVSFAAPQFKEPPCRWRPAGDAFVPFSLPDNGPEIPTVEISGNDAAGNPQDRQSIPICEGFCQFVNQFKYEDCLDVRVEVDDQNIPHNMCYHWGRRYLCTEDPVPDGNHQESCSLGGNPTPGANSRPCQGEECRCYGEGCINTNNGRFYWSYLRKYDGDFSRDSVPKDIQGDNATGSATVACYGAYHEFDPKKQQTFSPDNRCVINIDVSHMYQTQEGKGEYGQLSNWHDPDPEDEVNQRKQGAYDMNRDLWFERLGRGFSLLNESVFHNEFGKNLSEVYLNIDRLDRADLKGSNQLSDERPLAMSSDIRAFDDTGEERSVASWWQKQQQEVSELTHRPVVRLLLPTGWAFGIDPEDPLFTEQQAKAVTNEEKQAQRIEIQIDAQEDTLGTALGYLERSLLLRVEEEPIPVVVPLGSPTEFRARIQAWCSWYMRANGVRDCTDAPEPIRTYMDQLEQYADQIEHVRELRSELANYAGSILQLQQQLIKPISDWVGANIDSYQRILDEQQEIRTIVDAKWRPVQQLMNDFHEDANMPWCMNQRYTTPIYSLLDPWMPSRTRGSNAGEMPNLTAQRPEDIVIDFSTITYMTGALKLPVLEPIQIQLQDLPWPPNVSAIKNLPPLAPIDAIQAKVRASLSNLPRPPQNPPVPPPVTVTPMGQERIDEINSTMDRIHGTLLGMFDAYDRFWKSLAPLRPEEDSDDRNGIPEMKRRLECLYWDISPCIHVEMDLLERLTRIGSRPLVQLIEDYASKGPARGFGGACLPHDDTCVPTHPESTAPGGQWDMTGPKTQEEFIESLRKDIRDLTLPRPGGTLNPDDVPPYGTDQDKLLPVHSIPPAFDISPTP